MSHRNQYEQPPPIEYDAIRGYLRAAIAIASSPNATDEHAEALAESIIHLVSVRETLRPIRTWSAQQLVDVAP